MDQKDVPNFRMGDLAQIIFREQLPQYNIGPIDRHLLRVAEVKGEKAIHVCEGFFGNFGVSAVKYPLYLIDKIQVYEKQQYFFMF
jgi:hypothetical protein